MFKKYVILPIEKYNALLNNQISVEKEEIPPDERIRKTLAQDISPEDKRQKLQPLIKERNYLARKDRKKFNKHQEENNISTQLTSLKSISLYNYLLNKKDIGWDTKDYTITINDNHLKNTNIIDLLDSATNNRRKQEEIPNNFEDFKNYLLDTNVPSQYLGFRVNKSSATSPLTTRSHQTGTGWISLG
jgi:hypothetical protein